MGNAFRHAGSTPHPHAGFCGIEEATYWCCSGTSVASAAARCAGASSTAFPSLVAIPAIDRAVAARLKRYSRGLATTRTNHRRSLSRSRTVTGTPSLIVLFGLTTRLATFRCRITAFLKERLICSGEGKVLPAVAASELNISGHGVPRVEIVRHKLSFSCKDS